MLATVLGTIMPGANRSTCTKDQNVLKLSTVGFSMQWILAWGIWSFRL